QVGLHEPVVDGVRSPGGMGEALVTEIGSDVAAADEHLDQVAERVEDIRGYDAGLDCGSLGQSTEGGSDLPAVEADEGIGAEHDRIGGIEGGGCLRGHAVTQPQRAPRLIVSTGRTWQ